MDNKDLVKLEKLIAKKKHHNEAGYGVFTNLQIHGRAVLCGDDTNYKTMRRTRTHNVDLKDNQLWWENNNSKSWSYTFNTIEEAIEWWNSKFPTCPIIKNPKRYGTIQFHNWKNS